VTEPAAGNCTARVMIPEPPGAAGAVVSSSPNLNSKPVRPAVDSGSGNDIYNVCGIRVGLVKTWSAVTAAS